MIQRLVLLAHGTLIVFLVLFFRNLNRVLTLLLVCFFHLFVLCLFFLAVGGNFYFDAVKFLPGAIYSRRP